MFASRIAHHRAEAVKAQRGYNRARTMATQDKHFKAYSDAVAALLRMDHLVRGTDEEKLLAEALRAGAKG